MKTHITTTSIRRSILAGAFLALTTITSHAAVVTWGAAQGIIGDTDVSTNGTLVQAANFGTASTATVNGVTFAGFTGAGASTTVGNFTLSGGALANGGLGGGGGAFAALTPAYQGLLLNATGVPGANSILTLTMSNLTVGNSYEFQWWYNGSGVAQSTANVTAVAGNSVTVNGNPAGTLGSLGQFALGTFVANATSQAITFTGSAAAAGALNAAQLRLLPAASVVPEPGSALAGLLALGVCLSGLAGRSRRQEQPAA